MKYWGEGAGFRSTNFSFATLRKIMFSLPVQIRGFQPQQLIAVWQADNRQREIMKEGKWKEEEEEEEEEALERWSRGTAP